MPRIIEIALFLIPFVSFAAWRLLFPSPMAPAWLVYGTAGFVVVLLIALVWSWHLDANDANQRYLPDLLRDGRVITARPP